ncbi:MAG: patatin-like phospholipase family protein [Deltaproteobacteria bacterium]|nr:patatin-like phospholipase family protein [Deltaproteobacteria bacterium]
MGRKKLNLALQGGGAHGAFTWGVLDRLLEQKDLEIVGVSGTSAGAVNGACLVYGLTRGGNEAARDILHEFWRKNSESQFFSLLQPTVFDKALSRGNMDFNPFYWTFSTLTTYLSPYQWNPCQINPFRELLLDVIDFEAIQKQKQYKLFLSATNIRTSKVKIFANDEITADVVCASSCLPQFFQAIEIDGELYWDGGFIGNPAIFPLFQYTQCRDLMLIQIDSINYNKVPWRIDEITDRATDISFNSSLMREMRAICFVTRIIDSGFDDNGRLVRTNIHYISTGDLLNDYNSSSKYNVDWEWLTYLRDCGREEAEQWIRKHYNKVGKKNSCDVESLFL